MRLGRCTLLLATRGYDVVLGGPRSAAEARRTLVASTRCRLGVAETWLLETKFALKFGARLKFATTSPYRPSSRPRPATWRRPQGRILRDPRAGEPRSASRCSTCSPPTATCCCWSGRGARSTSSSAATTSGTGSSPPSPRPPRSAPSGRPRRRSSPPRSRPPRPSKGSGPRPATAARTPPIVRQGEWFFLPVARLRRGREAGPAATSRSAGATAASRTGSSSATGRAARRSTSAPATPTASPRRSTRGILAGNPKAKGWGWRTMRRNPGVYVRGRVRHADHATITLHGWHRVLMNTEGQSKAMRNVAFLD